MNKAKMSDIAPCGLECSRCDIHRAPGDPALMKQLLDWFKKERSLKLNPEQLRCDGCRGDRSKHWSPDCWILACCVDSRKHIFCNQCSEFPCVELEDWGSKNESYRNALKRLKNMREQVNQDLENKFLESNCNNKCQVLKPN